MICASENPFRKQISYFSDDQQQKKNFKFDSFNSESSEKHAFVIQIVMRLFTNSTCVDNDLFLLRNSNSNATQRKTIEYFRLIQQQTNRFQMDGAMDVIQYTSFGKCDAKNSIRSSILGRNSFHRTDARDCLGLFLDAKINKKNG